MPESLGEKLKQAREERGITISEVAEQTRISALYLESIENDDYRTLPGGIFNKGFVKSFAKYVGLDEHEALQDYSRLMSSQQTDEQNSDSGSYRPQVLTDDSSGPSMLPTIIFAVIILGLMTWGILALVNYLQTSESSQVNANLNDNNVKVDENANVNNNSNVNGSSPGEQALPPTDEIKVKLTAPELAITATIDGKREVRTLNTEVTEQVFEAKESLKFNYYKGLAETVKITLNGKQIETPLPPPGYRKNGFEYEINMDNIKQILKDGKFTFDDSTKTNTDAGANSNIQTKAPPQ
jgi:cytoskeletal protein RodZ